MITLRPLGIDDEGLVDAILDQLQTYSMNVDGVPKMADGARHLLTATPRGFEADAKHVFAVDSGADTVGVVDIIRDFPSEATAFIGLLAIVEPRQGNGCGRAALEAIEAFAKSDLGARKLRLAVVATNPVMGFWNRMGFQETGEVQQYTGEALTSTAHLMEKVL